MKREPKFFWQVRVSPSRTIGIAALFAFVLADQVALAQADQNRLYRSAYFLGRGDTGIATADNEEAVFYNPPVIAYGKGIYKLTILASPQVEVSQSARDLSHRL